MASEDIIDQINKIEESEGSSSVKEMSEEELDTFIEKKDPAFAKNIKKIKKLGKIKEKISFKKVKIKKISLPKLNVKAKLTQIKSFFNLNKIKPILNKLKAFFKKGLDYIKENKARVFNFSAMKSYVLGWGPLEWFLHSFLLLVVLGFSYFFMFYKGKQTVSDLLFEKEIYSWNVVEESSFSFDPEVDLLNNNLIAEQDHIFLLKKLIFNLKPTYDAPTGMAGLEFHINVEDEETAIVLKDEEKQISDYIQRSLETFNYTELNSKIGVAKIKKTVKDTINNYLKREVVKGVYIKQIMLKP